MIQWVLTYIVIFFALAWVVRELYESFKPKKQETCACGACSMGAKAEILEKMKQKKKS